MTSFNCKKKIRPLLSFKKKTLKGSEHDKIIKGSILPV